MVKRPVSLIRDNCTKFGTKFSCQNGEQKTVAHSKIRAQTLASRAIRFGTKWHHLRIIFHDGTRSEVVAVLIRV